MRNTITDNPQLIKLLNGVLINVFNNYYSSNDYNSLKQSKDIIIWNLFINEMKNEINNGEDITLIVMKQKHIFKIGKSSITFNKFDEKLKRSVPSSQLTIGFAKNELGEKILDDTIPFEIGYRENEAKINIYSLNSDRSQLILEIDRNKLHFMSINIEKDVSVQEDVITLRSHNNALKVQNNG